MPPLIRRVPTPALQRQAQDIVRQHVLFCASSTWIPNPIASSMVVTTLQLKMIAEISRLYGVHFEHDKGRALVASAAGGVLSYFLSKNPVTTTVRDFLMATVPTIAIPLRMFTGPAIMAAYTYILGNAFVRHYHGGGNYLNFNWPAFRYELAAKLGLPRPRTVAQPNSKALVALTPAATVTAAE